MVFHKFYCVQVKLIDKNLTNQMNTSVSPGFTENWVNMSVNSLKIDFVYLLKKMNSAFQGCLLLYQVGTDLIVNNPVGFTHCIIKHTPVSRSLL